MSLQQPPSPTSLTDRLPARFGRYILLDRLSAGGMGEVFRAKLAADNQFQRLVAIKCMLPRLIKSQSAVDMFLDEAKVAALLTHSNLLHIYELGYHGEVLFIAMELINGQDLRRVLRAARQARVPLPVPFLAYIMGQTASGLDFAHKALDPQGRPLNLVHRDITPANILVSYAGEVKLGDFGVVKARGRTQRTQPGVLKGKCAYMAPEQVKFGAVDARSDIFAMGAVLYEMLAGQRLFSGDDDEAVLTRIASGDLPDLRATLPADTDPRLHAILQHALAVNPAQRYQQASEMKQDLDSLLVHDNTVFGTTHAVQLMTQLFHEDMAAWPDKLRSYAKIGVRQCVVDLGGTERSLDAVSDPGPLDSFPPVPSRAPTRPSLVRRMVWWLLQTLASFGLRVLLRMAGFAVALGFMAGLLNNALRLEPPGTRIPTMATLSTVVRNTTQRVLGTLAAPDDGKHGYVSFSRRYGRVRIDGRELAGTPVGPQRLAVGTHRVELVGNDGRVGQPVIIRVTNHHSHEAPLQVY